MKKGFFFVFFSSRCWAFGVISRGHFSWIEFLIVCSYTFNNSCSATRETYVSCVLRRILSPFDLHLMQHAWFWGQRAQKNADASHALSGVRTPDSALQWFKPPFLLFSYVVFPAKTMQTSLLRPSTVLLKSLCTPRRCRRSQDTKRKHFPQLP